MRFVIAVMILIACGIPASQAATSIDGSCGNGVECPAGSCCSQWGFCGTGPTFCGNGNGGGSSNGSNNGQDGNRPEGQQPNNQPNGQQPNDQQPPNQQGGDGNNAGNTPQQPMATTPAANPNPSPQPTPNNSNNNNHANGSDSNKAISAVSALVVMSLSGYLYLLV